MNSEKPAPKKRGRKRLSAEGPKVIHNLNRPQEDWRINNARLVNILDIDSINKIVMND